MAPFPAQADRTADAAAEREKRRGSSPRRASQEIAAIVFNPVIRHRTDFRLEASMQ